MQSQPKAMTITGWILSILVTLLFLMGATMAIMSPPDMVKQMETQFGFFKEVLPVLAGLEIVCVLLYIIPRTAVLGAVLLTGYLGGAVATHVRVHDNFAMPLIVGVVVWLGLWLRDARVRNLLPIA